MATSLRELIVSVSADTTKYQREMDRASRMGGQYFRSVQQGGADASRSWDRQTSAARTHANALDASTQAISRYAAVAAGAFSVGTLIGMADDWGQISARIRIATASQEEFALAQTRLMEIANRTYRDYNEAADQFAGTAQSMREMGFAAADTLDAAEALGLALVAGGSNAQRGASANDAWAKSMVQGRIATDQFQTLLLQTPRVVQALGDGLGKTTQELQQMAKDGQLTANVVVPAITSQMGKLRAEVESMPTTVQDAGVRFRNELRAWIGGQNEAFGATQVLVRGIEGVTENMDALITIGGAAGLGMIAGKMVQIGAATAQAAVSAVQSRAALVAEAVAYRDATVAGLAKAQADLRRAQAAMTATRGTAESARQSRNLANALLIERQATVAAAQAQANYARATNLAAAAGRGALAILGGPAGLALTLGTVAAGWLLFRDNSNEATNALRDMVGPLDEVVAKYRELGAAQQLQAVNDAERAVVDSVESMQRAINNLNLNVGEGATGSIFKQIDADVQAGAISVEEGSRRMVAALNRYLETRDPGDRVRNFLIDQASRYEQAGQAAEAGRERVERFNKANAETAGRADAAAGGLRNQAGGYKELGEEAQKALQKMQDQTDTVRGQLERLGKSARDVARLDVRDEFRRLQREGLVDFSNREDPNVQRYIAAGRDLITQREALANAQKRLADSTRASAEAQRAANKEQSEAEKAAERLLEQYEDLAASQRREIALHGETGRAAAIAYDTAHGALANFTEAQKASLAESARWLDWLDDMAAIDSVNEQIAREATGKQEERMNQWSVFADQAARNIQSSLGDGLYSVLDGRFSDIGDSFANVLKRMAAELAASQIWQMVGNSLAGYSGQGAWGNVLRGIGGAMQTDGKRAGGGQVKPFGAYDVTEHGPEILQYGGRSVLMMGATGGVVSPLMNKAGGGAGEGRGKVQVTLEHKGSPIEIESASAEQRPDGTFFVRIISNTIKQGIARGEFDQDFARNFGMRRMGTARG